MRTAIEARLPWVRASILARPGVMPRTVPSFRTRAIIVSELQKVNLAAARRLPRPSKAAAKRACFWPTPSVMVSGVIWISETVWVWAETRGANPASAKPPSRGSSSQIGRRAGMRTRSLWADFTGKSVPGIGNGRNYSVEIGLPHRAEPRESIIYEAQAGGLREWAGRTSQSRLNLGSGPAGRCLAQVSTMCMLYVCCRGGAAAPRDRRRVAPHMRSEEAKMAELHYMEMGWSGSGWMDPLPMEKIPSSAPSSSSPSSFSDYNEPAARPRKKAAKKTAKKAARKAGRSAKRSARKSARKGRKAARKAGRSAKRSARKSVRKVKKAVRKVGRLAKRSVRKSARKGKKAARKAGRSAKRSARKSARKGRKSS